MEEKLLPLDRVLCLHGGRITVRQLMLYLENVSGHKSELADFVYNRLYEKYIEPFCVLEELKGNKELHVLIKNCEMPAALQVKGKQKNKMSN